jgi:hypothetical protein
MTHHGFGLVFLGITVAAFTASGECSSGGGLLKFVAYQTRELTRRVSPVDALGAELATVSGFGRAGGGRRWLTRERRVLAFRC